MRHPMTTADGRAGLRAFAAAFFLFSFEEISFAAVVTAAVQDLYARPDETSSVDDQVILGERVEILEDAAGFARGRTAAGEAAGVARVGTGGGEAAWIPEGAPRRGDAPAPAGTEVVRVTSNFAHIYATPSFTKQKPLLRAPVEAEMAFSDFLEGKEGEKYSWVRVVLPDGRVGFVARTDVALVPFEENPPLRSPPEWLAFGRRFLGAPYMWGGTTPLGFDCSGLVQRIFREHGVLLKRNSYEQAFQDPQLIPVSLEALRPGDLLFFGTEDRIDHEAMWLGDGTVLQSTRHGVPGVQVTPFDSPFLKPLFRYARRLKTSSNEKSGPELTDSKVHNLQRVLEAIADGSGARFGIFFKDLASGRTLSKNSSVSMHAASTMKTPVLLEVLRRVDSGTLAFTDEVLVKKEFKSLVDGSPFSIGLEEGDGPTMSKLGGKATLEFLVTEMIVRSSNLATNIVLSLV